MLSRITFPLFGIAYWQKAYANKDKIEQLNHEFVENSESAMTIVMIVIITLGVLLNILAWRRRRFASYIFYLEIVFLIVQSLQPVNMGDI